MPRAAAVAPIIRVFSQLGFATRSAGNRETAKAASKTKNRKTRTRLKLIRLLFSKAASGHEMVSSPPAVYGLKLAPSRFVVNKKVKGRAMSFALEGSPLAPRLIILTSLIVIWAASDQKVAAEARGLPSTYG